MFKHIYTQLWRHQNLSSLMINSWDAIRQPVIEAWSHSVCMCLCVCSCGCHCVSLSWGVIASGAATGASGCTWAAKDRPARKGAMAVIGQSGPAEKRVIRGSDEKTCLPLHTTERRQKHRRLSGMVYMEEYIAKKVAWYCYNAAKRGYFIEGDEAATRIQ